MILNCYLQFPQYFFSVIPPYLPSFIFKLFVRLLFVRIVSHYSAIMARFPYCHFPHLHPPALGTGANKWHSPVPAPYNSKKLHVTAPTNQQTLNGTFQTQAVSSTRQGHFPAPDNGTFQHQTMAFFPAPTSIKATFPPWTLNPPIHIGNIGYLI